MVIFLFNFWAFLEVSCCTPHPSRAFVTQGRKDLAQVLLHARTLVEPALFALTGNLI